MFFFRCSDTGAILIADIITTNHCLVLAEMNGKCDVLLSRIFHGTFVSACNLWCGNFTKRSEQVSGVYEDNFLIDA